MLAHQALATGPLARRSFRWPLSAAALLCLAIGAWSAPQCQGTWDPDFGQPGADFRVFSFAWFDDGTGEQLYAGGLFDEIGGVAATSIGRFDGQAWHSVGGNFDQPVNALLVHDDGAGPKLYAGGSFLQAGGLPAPYLARWDGMVWEAVPGLTGEVHGLWEHDDGSGPALYVGGDFAEGLLRWDGSFTSVGGGTNAPVYDMTTYDDGSGPALYATGAFTQAGGKYILGLARWDGTNWSGIGANLNDDGRSLAVFDDGGGPALFVGGRFAFAAGSPSLGAAKWDGSVWTQMSPGRTVYQFEPYDFGDGPRLLAGKTDDLMVWDGSTWSQFEGGTDKSVRALSATPDEIYLGGGFNFVGSPPLPSSKIARFNGPSTCPAGQTYCTAGFSASGCQASISATGFASATASSGFTLHIDGVEGGRDGLFFYGTNGKQANPWGNGTSFVCVVPPRLRGGLLAGVGSPGGSCSGAFSQDLNARWCATCPKPSHNPGPGAVMQAQLWYRDPASPSNQTSSLSDAIEFAIGP